MFAPLILTFILHTFNTAHAQDNQLDLDITRGQERDFFGALNATYLPYTVLGVGLIAIVIIGVAAVLYYGATNFNVKRNQYEYYTDSNEYYPNQQSYQNYYRSAQDNFDFNSMNVIQWISMLQELYEKFDYKDLDCQKRLICEVMKEPEYFGTVATQIKNGFQYAKYLEVLSLPDDMRETLDEYMEANSRAEGQKDCTEYFQCPYSLKESVKKNWEGNSL